jgi:ABC-type iron transport system FetAB ATPase subunit
MADALLRIAQLRSDHVGPLDLELAAGEGVAIHGPSGGGKSAFCRALIDLDRNEGACSCAGQDRRAMPAHAWRRLVMWLPAESAWWGERIRDHFPGHGQGLEARLAELRLAPTILDADPLACSSGERQRLALLRALLLGPRVLLLDEVTANLDPESEEAVVGLIAAHRQQGGASIWISHDAGLRRRVADRDLHLAAGAFSHG